VKELTEEDVKKAIQTAIQMERDGYDFYRKAAAQTSSDMGETIFNTLAEDELMHLDTFQKIFEDKIGKGEWNSLVDSSKKYANLSVFPKDLDSAGGVSPDTNELDALHIAMNSEKEAIDFYSGILEKLQDDEVKQIINEIIQQEKNHYLLLQEEFEHLGRTGYWYDLDYLGG
jgi:rubrerythrin